jgi:hypothetical protein
VPLDPELSPNPGQNKSGIFNANQQFNQFNVHFQPELPDPDKFKAFPESAQKVILDCVVKEQSARHGWMDKQQSNEHQINLANGRYYFWWKIIGATGGFLLALSALTIGYFLIKNGCSAMGAGFLVTAVGGLVAVAIWGQKQKTTPPEKDLPAKTEDSQGG